MRQEFFEAGQIIIPLHRDGDMVYDEDGTELHTLIPIVCDGGKYNLVIDFISHGWHDPGQRSGRVENTTPPDGEEERYIEDTWLLVGFGDKATMMRLSKEAIEEVKKQYCERVKTAPITENQI